MPRHRWFGVLLVLPLLLVATTSSASSSRQAKERAARKACLNGDYAKGVSLLSDLFLDTRDPTYIFNQGRCFEQNRRYEDAVARFEEYLRAADNPRLDEADKAAAEKHIADCKEILAQQSGKALAPVASPPVAPPPVALTPSPPAQPDSSTAIVIAQSSPQRSDGARWRTAGIITASAGAAALIAGVALNLKVNSMASDMELPGNYSAGRESDRKTYETMGWVSYGVGAVGVLTGSVLYVMGRSARPSPPTPLAIVPELGPGHAGAVLEGAF